MSSPEKKLRLDDLLVARGLATTKAQAQALIMAGKVLSGTVRLDKPGKKVPADFPLTVQAPPRFVSRGGEKLLAALQAFPVIAVTDALCLDVGACTGGFTDCLLQHGARTVVAIDVGHHQLHSRLAADPRVISIEGLNARALTPAHLPHPAYDIIVMDVAFISQLKVLPATWPLLRPGGYFISLIKPQFEVTKAEADRCQGVVKDEAIRQRVISEVRTFATTHMPHLTEVGLIDSPIEGGEGNKEYLVIWHKSA